MLQNYEYFLTLAETKNISKAAEKLYVSHQCLSRYLKNLEDECGLTLFQRKPSLSLTYAGQVLADSMREIQRIEQNTMRKLIDLKDGTTGAVRLGVTEGRLRIFLPGLIKEYQEMFPGVTLQAVSAPTKELLELLVDNKLDLVLGSPTDRVIPNLEYLTIMEEDLYLVVSDSLLEQYFPDSYPDCKEKFRAGADIHLFREMPFCAATKGYNSRSIIDEFLQTANTTIRIIYEANQPDLLHLMTAHDYAASFSLSMYLPHIYALNRSLPEGHQLNVFPIKGLSRKNPIFLIYRSGTYFPNYTKALIGLIQRQCTAYQEPAEQLLW